MNASELEQGTPEWLMARLGKITASKIGDVIAVTKNGPSERRNKLMWQLVVERLTGDFTRTFTNDAMLWGLEHEPVARDFYCSLMEVDMEQVGLILHPRMEFAGASPDGVLPDNGGWECKCLTTVNHIKAVYSNLPPSDYLPQVHWQMACGGYDYVDLTLFDPRVPLEMQLKVFRIERDDKEIARLEDAVEAFNGEIEAVIETLRNQTK